MSSAIFGYGSLIFKAPPFDSITSEPGYIKGFVRRFAQKSHDHRGTKEHPGRVVTLCDAQDWKAHQKDEPPETGHIWGRVYRIPESDADEIWAYLDHREKDGYTQRTVDVYSLDEQRNEFVVEKDCKVYVGETDNPSFAGGEPMHELAHRIATSVGPSGPNREYLYRLAEAVRQLAKEDDAYLTRLEQLVREAEKKARSSETTADNR